MGENEAAVAVPRSAAAWRAALCARNARRAAGFGLCLSFARAFPKHARVEMNRRISSNLPLARSGHCR